MADDLDFVWAQTDKRGAPTAPPAIAKDQGAASGDIEWVTLRDAADRTAIPISTIRNWARKHKIPTRLAEETAGKRRMVGMGEVLLRARELGRVPAGSGETAAATTPAAGAERTHPAGDHAVPEGHMLVPLDAWEKMLVQLGNLHSAGQELADARERAARAETEAEFLRERVADLRETRDRLLAVAPTEPDRAEAAQSQTWYHKLADRMRKRP